MNSSIALPRINNRKRHKLTPTHWIFFVEASLIVLAVISYVACSRYLISAVLFVYHVRNYMLYKHVYTDVWLYMRNAQDEAPADVTAQTNTVPVKLLMIAMAVLSLGSLVY